MKKVLRAGLCLALVAGAQSVAASEVPEQEGAYRIGEIVVSASPNNIVENAGTVYRVTAQQIKDQNARTLDEALQLVPGLIVREGAEGTPRIDIRGFRTRHVQFFINGIPLKSSYDGQFDPTRIPADIISEIKVTSGGGSVLYGAGGNGGAIDIITKAGVEGVHGSIGAEVLEGPQFKGNASLYGTGERVNFYGNVSILDRDAYPLSSDFTPVNSDVENGGDRENSDRKRFNLYSNVSYDLSDANTLGFTFSRLDGENGKPPVTNYDKNDALTKKTKYERIDDIDNTLVQLAFDHDPAGPFGFRGWAYYSTTSELENRYDDDSYTSQTKKNSFSQDSETEIVGISTQFQYQVDDRATATLGLIAENESWEAEGFEIKDSGSKKIDDDYDLQNYSAALEYERQLTDSIGIVAGYGHYFHNREEGDDNDFSYLIGATYDWSEDTRFRLNHARKVRFPSVKQLYGKDGNPDLDTEVTYHYEAGVEQRIWKDGVWNLTGFYIDAEDFIEKVDENGETVTKNFQDIRIAGVETGVTLRPLDRLETQLALTWLDTEDKSADSDRDELQYRPEWKVSATAKYTFDFGMSIFGSILYVANQYFYDDDQTVKGELDDFTIVNLKVSQKFVTTGMELYVGVNNLFDEDYEESYGLPKPGQMFYGGFEYRF